MSNERAVEVMKEMVAMFSTGDLSDIQQTVHSDYLDHQGLHGERIRGPAGFFSPSAWPWASPPGGCRCGEKRLYDSRRAVENLIPAEDRAAARLQWSGLRPDGQVSSQTLEIVRIEDGMAIEHWGGRS